MFVGGNGDYYLNLVEYPEDQKPQAVTVRVAMSGGFAPPSVKLAIMNNKSYREYQHLSMDESIAELNKQVSDRLSTQTENKIEDNG